MSSLEGFLPANRRLRIAVLNRNFSPTGGGAERYSIALVEQLAARHDIHVFAQTMEHHWPGVTYHKISQPLKRPRWINQLWYAAATWWATRNGFDIVHSHENTWHGQVQTVHVLPIKYNLFVGRTGLARALRWVKVLTSPRLLVYVWLEHMRYAVKPGRALVVTSSTLQNIMRQSHPHTMSMLHVVTPGVTDVPGKASASTQLQARRTLGLPENGHCILFVGNDYQKKGLTTLLEAMCHLPEEVVLAVVGNPAHIPAFKAKALAAGLGQRVFFLGALKDVAMAYQAADCLAHPTQEDTFAMVVLEAMAHGLPVVVSSQAYCGISDLLTDGKNALILQNPTDTNALSNLLRTVLSDVALRHYLGTHAAEFAISHQWSQVALGQEAIYQASDLASRH
jgi:UDP-glucose:(heptosyl)LPS alpha-1,3-glucosyltransferase